MTATIDIISAVYAVLEDAAVTDIGAGGLREPNGAAYVREILRDGHPRENDNLNWPQLRIAVIANQNEAIFSTADRPEVLVRMTIWTKRERKFSSSGSNESGLDNILIRIRNLYNGFVVTGVIFGGWTSTIMHLIRGPAQIPGSDNEMRHLYEFDLTAKVL